MPILKVWAIKGNNHELKSSIRNTRPARFVGFSLAGLSAIAWLICWFAALQFFLVFIQLATISIDGDGVGYVIFFFKVLNPLVRNRDIPRTAYAFFGYSIAAYLFGLAAAVALGRVVKKFFSDKAHLILLGVLIACTLQTVVIAGTGKYLADIKFSRPSYVESIMKSSRH